jgi:hypothetical protein
VAENSAEVSSHLSGIETQGLHLVSIGEKFGTEPAPLLGDRACGVGGRVKSREHDTQSMIYRA